MTTTGSFADLVQAVRLRIDAITANLLDLAGVGIQQTDVDDGVTLFNELQRLDSEQEALKAALKTKTAELNAMQKQAREWRQRMDKRIKVAYEDQPERWIEFGITASR